MGNHWGYFIIIKRRPKETRSSRTLTISSPSHLETDLGMNLGRALPFHLAETEESLPRSFQPNFQAHGAKQLPSVPLEQQRNLAPGTDSDASWQKIEASVPSSSLASLRDVMVQLHWVAPLSSLSAYLHHCLLTTTPRLTIITPGLSPVMVRADPHL
jgi:hypothetical protein